MIEFKRQFDKVAKMSCKYHTEKAKLDKLIVERWGFHYSDVDDDWNIDMLDYGNGLQDYKTFCKQMDDNVSEARDRGLIGRRR